MLIVLLWTILIFAKSPGASSATATAAAPAAVAAAAAATASAASMANKSTADSDKMRSTSASGAFLDANGAVVNAVVHPFYLSNEVRCLGYG